MEEENEISIYKDSDEMDIQELKKWVDQQIANWLQYQEIGKRNTEQIYKDYKKQIS